MRIGELGNIGSLDTFAQTIQQVEGYLAPGTPGYPEGSLAYRNNNPGNLIYTGYYASNFAAEPGVGGFSKFPDYQTGYAALQHQIQVDGANGLTILQMMNKYAPASDGNNPGQYAQTIANALGVNVDTPVRDVIGGGSVQTMQPSTTGPEFLDGVWNGGVTGFELTGAIVAGLAGLLVLDLVRR